MSVTRLVGLAPMFLLSACVTVNVYFPQAAADTAARSIVRDVLGEEVPASETQSPAQGTEPQSRGVPHKGSTVLGWASWVDLFVPAARAGANLQINTPAIKAIRDSLRARQPHLREFFTNGALGLTSDGLVAVRSAEHIPLRDRNRVKKLVADENRDRNALYREIAKANGHPEWEADIRSTFAKVWVQESPAGTWYQGQGGAWKVK